MHWKLFSLIAALMLMVATSAPPNTVEAQEFLAPTDNIRRALVVGVGTTQTLNLYINVHSTGLPADRIFQPFITVQNAARSALSDDSTCTQTIQAEVNLSPGLNVLALGIASEEEGKNKKLLVNGDAQEPPLGDCFNETNRVVYLIKGEVTSLEPNYPTSAATIPLQRIGGLMIYDITDPSGATAATGGLDLPQKFLIFEDRNGDIS